MADVLNKYRNRSGYTIKATLKAYNLFYKKQGFVPVEESDASEPAAKEPAKKGKGTKAADKAAAEPETPAESVQEE